jgi:O-antigen/teichoic acid export membrane protein
MVLSRRMIPALRFHVREIRWERARELMSFGGWSFVGQMAIRVRETLLLYVLNRMATPLDVTVFSVGSLGRRQIDAWMSMLAGPLYPVVTGMHAVGARERVRAVYLRGGRIALWVMLLIVLPGVIYARPTIRLYAGNTYVEAAVVMVLTLAALPLAGGAWLIWQVANATGRVRGTGLYVLVTQPLIIALSFHAVKVLGWGASGVALSSFVVSAVANVLLLWPLGLKLADVQFGTWVRRTLIPGLTPGCMAAVVWAALPVVVTLGTWPRLGLCILAGSLCYGIVLLGLCLEPQDKEDLSWVVTRIRDSLGRPPLAPYGPRALSAAGAEESDGEGR